MFADALEDENKSVRTVPPDCRRNNRPYNFTNASLCMIMARVDNDALHEPIRLAFAF